MSRGSSKVGQDDVKGYLAGGLETVLLFHNIWDNPSQQTNSDSSEG
jgi:hypothetical protein